MNCLDLFDLQEKIQIMDVGAAAIAETPVYKKLIEIGLGKLNAFEGDQRQLKKLKEEYGDNIALFTDFLFDGTIQNLYLANPNSGMTSLLQPKEKAVNFFNGFDRFSKIEKVETVKTKKLNDINNLPKIDFVKMDIQGSELTVLKNGLDKIKDSLAIQIEVSFICLYENQPSFGEIDLWMRSNGFVPHCFLDVKKWSIAPIIFNNNFRTPGNQLLESDIVYIKDPLQLNHLSDDQIKKFILISHYCFMSIDLTAFLIIELEKRKTLSKDSFKKYIDNIKKFINESPK